jgi:hypothetical protein
MFPVVPVWLVFVPPAINFMAFDRFFFSYFLFFLIQL